jgi:tetratricopeptide (TPR) repeat protein
VKAGAFMITIAINPTAKRITFTTAVTQHIETSKNFEFLCALIALPHDDYVYSDVIGQLPGWARMLPESIGKQVSRMIALHARLGISIIDYHQKTNGWRLAPGVRADLPQTEIDAARIVTAGLGWSSDRRFAAQDTSGLSQWFRLMATAMVAMTSGEADKGLAAVKQGMLHGEGDALSGIANIIASRLGQRMPTPHAPVASEHDGLRSPFELALEARRSASYAIRAKSDEWPAHLAALEHQYSMCARTGDFTTQVVLLNAMAVLARRLGAKEKALVHIKEAAPLAILSGDFFMIQAVSFNMGNVLSDLYETDGSACARSDYIGLLQLDIDIRDSFGLGRDSAQAELRLAALYCESGALMEAQDMLDAANRIIVISNTAHDRALALQVQGKLEIAQGHLEDGLATLKSALFAFEATGNQSGVEETRAELSQLRQR